MSFFHAFNDALKQLLPPSENEILSQQIIECMDLTLLDKSVLPNQIDKLIAQAQQQPIAAVCVYPEHLSYFNHLAINLATVVNFPHGTDDKQVIYNDIERAIQQGASEVDYVFPYEQYIKGDQLKALAQAQEVLDFCQQKQLITKVIIETGSFSDLSLLFTASQQLAQMGWHFLKTSTGKISQGASLTAVTCLLAAISESKASCGIKVSGGVRTLEQAKQFIVLAETILVKKVHKDWFRIGTSNLLSEILS